jgi:hypothetical protein
MIKGRVLHKKMNTQKPTRRMHLEGSTRQYIILCTKEPRSTASKTEKIGIPRGRISIFSIVVQPALAQFIVISDISTRCYAKN